MSKKECDFYGEQSGWGTGVKNKCVSIVFPWLLGVIF
jgi:hypothetical protein